MEKQNDKGKLGKGTPSSRLKTLYKKEVSRDSRHEPTLSLKEWLRATQTTNSDFKTWTANKLGKNADKRTDAKLAKILVESSATKQAKKAKKGK